MGSAISFHQIISITDETVTNITPYTQAHDSKMTTLKHCKQYTECDI